MDTLDDNHLQTTATPVVGRFAPSPSGRMHLGNAFSSLMGWLAVRAAGGRMVMRIEDLDPRANSRERAEQLMDDLRWLGLDWDEGPFYQSDRIERYEEALNRLEQQGLIYPCFCSRAELHAASAPHAADGTFVYQGTCRGLTRDEIARRASLRAPALRLRVPEPHDPAGTIHINDRVFGERTEILAHECGDFLVRRSDGVFAYQLAVVVDDAEMGVNLVVRGRDLLGSSARQTYLARLLGHEAPAYAHVPLLIAPDGRRLAKRDRDLDLGVLRERGLRPEHVVGALAHAAGLIAEPADLAAADLVESFSWEALRAHRRDIVADASFLS